MKKLTRLHGCRVGTVLVLCLSIAILSLYFEGVELNVATCFKRVSVNSKQEETVHRVSRSLEANAKREEAKVKREEATAKRREPAVKREDTQVKPGAFCEMVSVSGNIMHVGSNAPILQTLKANVKKGEPIVMRAAAVEWPAMKRWHNISYMKQRAGDQKIRARDFEGMSWKFSGEGSKMIKMMPVKEFLSKNVSNDVIAIAADTSLEKHLTSLLRDVDFTPFHLNGVQKAVATSLFTARHTELHHHYEQDSVAVSVTGAKTFILFPPSESENVDKRTGACKSRKKKNWSLGDCTSEDTKFVKSIMARAKEYQEVRLEPGDALYIPAYWWHTVHAQLEADSGSVLGSIVVNQFMVHDLPKKKDRNSARKQMHSTSEPLL